MQPARVEPRRHPSEPLELRLDYGRLNAFFADYARSLCRGSLFVPTRQPLNAGSDLCLRLVVPVLDEPLRLRARVAWVVAPLESTDQRPAGMGLEFLFGGEAARDQFRQRVEQAMVEQLGLRHAQRLLGREPCRA